MCNNYLYDTDKSCCALDMVLSLKKYIYMYLLPHNVDTHMVGVLLDG